MTPDDQFEQQLDEYRRQLLSMDRMQLLGECLGKHDFQPKNLGDPALIVEEVLARLRATWQEQRTTPQQ